MNNDATIAKNKNNNLCMYFGKDIDLGLHTG